MNIYLYRTFLQMSSCQHSTILSVSLVGKLRQKYDSIVSDIRDNYKTGWELFDMHSLGRGDNAVPLFSTTEYPLKNYLDALLKYTKSTTMSFIFGSLDLVAS